MATLKQQQVSSRGETSSPSPNLSSPETEMAWLSTWLLFVLATLTLLLAWKSVAGSISRGFVGDAVDAPVRTKEEGDGAVARVARRQPNKPDANRDEFPSQLTLEHSDVEQQLIMAAFPEFNGE